MQYVCDAFTRWVAFFVARAALWRPASSVRVAGAALQTCRFACFLRIAMSGLCEVVATCKFRSRRDILWDGMRSDGNLARNIDFEIAKVQVPEKTRRKTSILKLKSVKIWGRLAWNARFDAPTCLVSSLWFSCGLERVYSGSCKIFSFGIWKVSKQVVIWFLWQAWHFLIFSWVWKRIGIHFVWRAQYSCIVFKSLVAFFVAGAALWRHPLSFCVAGAALETCHVVCFLANTNVRAAPSGDNVQICGRRGMLWHAMTFHTPHFTLYTPHLTLYTSHFAFYTPHDTWHFTLRTLDSTLYTLHCALYTLHSTLWTLHCQLNTPHFTFHSLHSTLYTAHSTLHTLHSQLYTPHSTLCTPHFTLDTLLFPLLTLHSTIHTLHSTLYTLHSTLLHILHSTLFRIPLVR